MTIQESDPISAEEAAPTNVVGNDVPTFQQQEDTSPTNTTEQNKTSEEENGANENDENDDNSAPFDADGAVGNARERKVKHWKDSDFAVGCVNVTWKDDRPKWWCDSSSSGNGNDHDDTRVINHSYTFSSIVCGCLGAGRVGNMAILAQSTEDFEEEVVDSESGQVTINHKTRPKLLWVVGPYWTVNIFITFPLIFGVSGWICYQRVAESSLVVIITWSIGTFLMTFSLCMISCRNPGILRRHSQMPTTTEGEEDWRWNDQARTYRPPSSRFDTECQVVVEGFDHTCPWTGTAIGSRNMFWFKLFVCMIPCMLVYTFMLAAFGGFVLPF